MVVTGLRFVNKNNIIYMQVQQGKLLPYGRIDASTLEWVPVDSDSANYIQNIDIYIMNWHKKILDLHLLPEEADTMYIPEEAVLTGVKFNILQRDVYERDTRLFLEIQLTRFNFEVGKLYPKRASVWINGLGDDER